MSEPHPIRLVPREREPWPDLIDRLKSLLARAEAGELMSFAYVAEVHEDFLYGQFHDVGSMPIKMIGQIELLKVRIIARHGHVEDDE